MKARISHILEQFQDFAGTDDFEKRPILTAYVNLDSTDANNRKERPAWMIELKNEARRLEESLDQRTAVADEDVLSVHCHE